MLKPQKAHWHWLSKTVQSGRRRHHLEDSFNQKRGQPARSVGGQTFYGGHFIPFVASWSRLLWPPATFPGLTLQENRGRGRSYSQAYTTSFWSSPFQPMNNCGLPVQPIRPGKSHWHIQCHAACHPTSEKILGRCDHHYVVWGWPVWLCQPEPLLGNQVGTDRFHQDTLHRTGRIRYPCQCDPARRRRGPRIQRVLEDRAKLSGKSVEEEKTSAMSIQSLQRFVDPRDIAALAVFLASDAGKSISGAMVPIDNDTQKAS